MASIVKRGHQTGARFQEIINFVNEQYERAGVACITRKAVPGKYVRGKQNPNTSLSVSTRISATDFRKLSQHHFSQKFIPESKAEPDYGGVIAPHGQGIFYDAKSTTRQSLDFDNLHIHQIEFLERVAKAGAVAGFLVEFSSHHSVYFLPIQALTLWKRHSTRKSIPYNVFEQHLTPAPKSPSLPLDYLQSIKLDGKWDALINHISKL